MNLSAIPHKPGCYLYKDKLGKIIYVGKAKDLKKRVSSYFSKSHPDKKTRQLVLNIATLDFLVTDTEAEALLLENNLIKKHQPKYNINLKDAKQYTYLLLTKEAYPRLLKVRDKKLPGQYFGPFVSGMERMDLTRLLNRTFKLRTCKTLPKRACLRKHIGLCSAPCVGDISPAAYAEDAKHVALVLKGKTLELIEQLKTKMKHASEQEAFEDARLARDQISALNHLQERQHVERQKKHTEDIINFIIKDEKIYLLVFHIDKGVLHNKQSFSFSWHEDWLDQFLVQYYDKDVPKELVLPCKPDQAVVDYLSTKKGSKVNVTVPKQGEKKTLLDLVKKNVEITFFGEQQALESLQEKLKLHELPAVIECFDISHLQGKFTVGSMVQFRYGKPDKSNYRRFRIKTVSGIDDFASIAEVVSRRYTRLVKEQAELPNLIVIDGGRGQLNAAIDVLRNKGLRIPIISLAKRQEEIYVPGRLTPIRLAKKDKALQVLQQVRDEAHRFAISYNRLLRKKEIQ